MDESTGVASDVAQQQNGVDKDVAVVDLSAPTSGSGSTACSSEPCSKDKEASDEHRNAATKDSSHHGGQNHHADDVDIESSKDEVSMREGQHALVERDEPKLEPDHINVRRDASASSPREGRERPEDDHNHENAQHELLDHDQGEQDMMVDIIEEGGEQKNANRGSEDQHHDVGKTTSRKVARRNNDRDIKAMLKSDDDDGEEHKMKKRRDYDSAGSGSDSEKLVIHMSDKSRQRLHSVREGKAPYKHASERNPGGTSSAVGKGGAAFAEKGKGSAELGLWKGAAGSKGALEKGKGERLPPRNLDLERELEAEELKAKGVEIEPRRSHLYDDQREDMKLEDKRRAREAAEQLERGMGDHVDGAPPNHAGRPNPRGGPPQQHQEQHRFGGHDDRFAIDYSREDRRDDGYHRGMRDSDSRERVHPHGDRGVGGGGGKDKDHSSHKGQVGLGGGGGGGKKGGGKFGKNAKAGRNPNLDSFGTGGGRAGESSFGDKWGHDGFDLLMAEDSGAPAPRVGLGGPSSALFNNMKGGGGSKHPGGKFGKKMSSFDKDGANPYKGEMLTKGRERDGFGFPHRGGQNYGIGDDSDPYAPYGRAVDNSKGTALHNGGRNGKSHHPYNNTNVSKGDLLLAQQKIKAGATYGSLGQMKLEPLHNSSVRRMSASRERQRSVSRSRSFDSRGRRGRGGMRAAGAPATRAAPLGGRDPSPRGGPPAAERSRPRDPTRSPPPAPRGRRDAASRSRSRSLSVQRGAVFAKRGRAAATSRNIREQKRSKNDRDQRGGTTKARKGKSAGKMKNKNESSSDEDQSSSRSRSEESEEDDSDSEEMVRSKTMRQQIAERRKKLSNAGKAKKNVPAARRRAGNAENRRSRSPAARRNVGGTMKSAERARGRRAAPARGRGRSPEIRKTNTRGPATRARSESSSSSSSKSSSG